MAGNRRLFLIKNSENNLDRSELSESSNVVYLSNKIKNKYKNNKNSSVLSECKNLSPHIQKMFNILENAGIDIEPLNKRFLNDEKLDILRVIIHFREYTALILRAIYLKNEHKVSILKIHPDEVIGKYAQNFVDNLPTEKSDQVRFELKKLLTWLENDEEVVDIINSFNKVKSSK